MSLWTLTDIDNRDDAGAGWETTDRPDSLAEYIDGPVRRDLSESADETELDDLLAAFRAGDLHRAQSLGKPFAIYVNEATEGGGDDA